MLWNFARPSARRCLCQQFLWGFRNMTSSHVVWRDRTLLTGPWTNVRPSTTLKEAKLLRRPPWSAVLPVNTVGKLRSPCTISAHNACPLRTMLSATSKSPMKLQNNVEGLSRGDLFVGHFWFSLGRIVRAANSIWRFRTRLISPVRELLADPRFVAFISLSKHSILENRTKSAESRAPEINRSFGEE